ncbi:MAG: hypothetical protein FWC34_11125 [Bacteroidetes bacterium]|nr:hypothetical protein [Bacteroidota bacterium]MCL2302906.1 hypothetical protein [Lentimicrobiaceae bacterium]
MLVLDCLVEIQGKSNKIKFTYANSIKVTASIRNLTDTATVVLPRKMSMKGKKLNEFVKRGDKISIQVGYLDIDSQNIFNGYITSVSSETPIKIEAENEMWKLKQITVNPTRYDKFKLKDFLSEHAPDVELVMPENIEFGEVIIQEETTVAKVLDYLKQNYPFNAFFDGKKMIAIMLTSQLQNSKEIKFKKGLNIISDTLKYTLADDVNIQIVAKSILSDNTKLESKKGDTKGEVRTFYAPEYKTQKELDQYAQKMLDTYKADKMSGDFTAFGIPFVKKGDKALLYDDDNKERNEKKFIADAIVYDYGFGGYRQVVTLGDEIK